MVILSDVSDDDEVVRVCVGFDGDSSLDACVKTVV